MPGRRTGEGSSIDELTQERVARNDARFREANEAIHDVVVEHGGEAPATVPFICECAEPRCTQIVLMSRSDYETVRSDPRWFLSVPGHEPSDDDTARVVRDEGTYVIVEKIGRAGEVAERLAEPSREAESHGRA